MLINPGLVLAQTCEQGVGKNVFARVLQEEFSSLVGSQGPLDVNSHASVSTQDGKATVGLTLLDGNSVFTLQASGRVADGTVPVLGGGRFASGFSVKADWHLLSREKNSITFDNASCRSYLRDVLAAENKLRTELVALGVDETGFDIRPGQVLANQRLELDRLDTKIETTRARAERKRQEERTAAQVGVSVERRQALGKKADSLEASAAHLAEQRRQLAGDVASTESTGRWSLREDAIARRNAAVRAAEGRLIVRGAAMEWVSFRFLLAANAFSLFDPMRAPSDQIQKLSFTAYQVGITWNNYRTSSAFGESRYFAFGVGLAHDHNLPDLTKHNIKDRFVYSESDPERTEERTTTAYSGEYSGGQKFLEGQVDYYLFTSTDNRTAIHVFAGGRLRDVLRLRLGVGLLVAALTADGKSKLNIELFGSADDVLTPKDSSQSLWDRARIGVRITTPFIFKPRD
ncbi:MAG: hypothetical protein JJ896_15155 [Rhodothermales bacterium]|nr:hypothetical protein [Rhodothermales bacterium]